MKTFAVIGITLLAFIVWWPAGVALLLFGVWKLGTARDKDQGTAAVLNATTKVAQAGLDATSQLLKENLELKHDLNLREVYRINEAIGEKIDEVLEDKSLSHPSVPAYHAWQIIHDITHELTTRANDAAPADRAGALSVLAYLERACDGIVRLACTDQRWSLYQGRELSFEDFREMRGLAHVVVDKIISLAIDGGATQVPEQPAAKSASGR